MEPIELFGITFLPHTWPLVFGLPTLLILGAVAGAVYELVHSNNK